MSRHDGVAGAVARSIEPPAGEARQLGLLDGINAAGVALRKPGRPPGAKNRKTVEMIEFLERRYRSPLEGLARTWSTATAALAEELGCTVEEAFDKQQAARIAALPFWHQRLSPDVSVNTGQVVNMTWVTGEHIGAEAEAGRDLNAELAVGLASARFEAEIENDE